MRALSASLGATLLALLLLNGCAGRSTLALHQATKESDLATIRSEIELGTEVDGRDDDGRTPLHNTLYKSKSKPDLEVIRLLIDLGADVNALDDRGRSPFHLAIMHNHARSLVPLLLEAGADPDLVYVKKTSYIKRYSPLKLALVNDKPDIAIMLLEAGADPLWRDSDGRRALHFACADSANIEAVKLLLEKGAPVNDYAAMKHTGSKSGYSPLMIAVSTADDPELVRLLLAAGAEPSGDYGQGTYGHERRLLNAVPYGKEEKARAILKALIDAGLSDPINDPSGLSALHSAALAGASAGTIQMLLDAGADPNMRYGPYQKTPLLLAVGSCDSLAIATLTAGGADPNIATKGGIYPLAMCFKSAQDAYNSYRKKTYRNWDDYGNALMKIRRAERARDHLFLTSDAEAMKESIAWGTQRRNLFMIPGMRMPLEKP